MIKLSVLTPLVPKAIDVARRIGYDGLEANTWLGTPALAHLEDDLAQVKEALAKTGMVVTSLAVYGGTINLAFDEAMDIWGRACRVAKALKCPVISAMTGRDNALTVQDNMPLYAQYFGPIADMAGDDELKIAFEPWPGMVQGHGPYDWVNLATTPELWDMLFEAVPNPVLGLEYDPSHLAWQGIDYVQVIRDYADRIHHAHAKDIVIDQEKLKRVGVHGQGWWRFVLPGLGQLDWGAIFAALNEVGYKGAIAVEHEDEDYMKNRWNEGLTIAYKSLRPHLDAYL